MGTVISLAMTSCENHREPGRIYMPDMTYSRALESYAALDSNIFTTDPTQAGKKIYYNRMPVNGAVDTSSANGIPEYALSNDSAGYANSATVKNPLGPLSSKDSAEAARLFNINCAICHGAGGKANGPISDKIGAVANLTTEVYVKMADGTMFHSIKYGKNNMGSYASQLSAKQRWMVIQYIRTIQPKPTIAAANVSKPDSASAVKK